MSILLVTGCFRSGTTLTEKLLHQHPEVCVASQPLPILYYLAKQAFLDARGLARRYPLDHLFGERGWRPGDFEAFLDAHVLSEADLGAFWDRLTDWEEAHWTREVLSLRGTIAPGPFPRVYEQLLAATADLLGGGRVIGSKEVLVEEYLPWVLERGWGIVSLRDPRDLITSQDFNERHNTTGAKRPLLHSLRQWRKSVAFARRLEHHPRFAWHRYEDLVTEPAPILARWSTLLDVAPFVLPHELRGQDGQPWSSNSSFAPTTGLSSGSVGRFRDRLPRATLRYIEAVCGPEMDALGYPRETDAVPSEVELSAYREPHAALHRAFPPDYSTDAARIAAEASRGDRTIFAEPPT